MEIRITPIGGKEAPSGTYVQAGIYTAEVLANGHLLYRSANGEGKTFNELEVWYEADFNDADDANFIFRMKPPNTCPSQQFVVFSDSFLIGSSFPTPISREFGFSLNLDIEGPPPNYTGRTILGLVLNAWDPLDPDFVEIILPWETCGW